MKETVEYIVFIVIFSIALLISNWSAAEPKNNILFGLTLPQENLKDSRVLSIIKKYKKSCILALIFFLIGIIPLFFIQYPSILFLYLCLWFVLILLVNSYIIKVHRQSLYLLKFENKWVNEKGHIVTIDTKVTMLKDKMPINKLYFLPCLIIPILASLIRFLQGADTSDIIMNGWSLLIIVINFIIFQKVSKGSNTVFSKDTNINLACNQIYKRKWSECWLFISYIVSICFAGFSFLGFEYEYSREFLIGLIALISISSYLIIIFARNKVRFSQEQLLRTSGSTVYVDDDEYWIGGLYNNPNDKRWSVERRIGYGLDFNMATTGGRLIMFSICTIVIIVLLAVFIYKFRIDFML